MPINLNEKNEHSMLPSNRIDRMISLSMLSSDENDADRPISQRLKKSVLVIKRKRLRRVKDFGRYAWNNTSSKHLEEAESKIFEILSNSIDGRFVSVRNRNEIEQIWTISLNVKSENVPLVLVHGFGGGVALWSLNLDALAADRPVFAFDLPGFARSSRPTFSFDHRQVENEFVEIFEQWRISVGLNKKFLLLGHSFGAFISTAYALRYSQWIKQLILVDPWGFAQRPENIWQTGRLQKIPTWLRSFSPVFMKISPLVGLRAAGPLGVPAIKHFRSDLRVKFDKLFHDDRILLYLYHCNTQKPTGEQAFQTLSDCFAWAKGKMSR